MSESGKVVSFLRKQRNRIAAPIRTLSKVGNMQDRPGSVQQVPAELDLFGAMDKLYKLSDEERLNLIFSTRKTQAFAFLMNLGDSPEASYRDLVEMGRAGLVASYLDIVTNDAMKKSPIHKKKLWVEEIKYEGKDYKDEVERMFTDLGVEQRIWQWTHEMCHFGDKFLKPVIVPKKGIVSIRDDFSAMDVLRVEFNGELAAFVYTDPDFSLLSQPMYGFGAMEFQKSKIAGPDSFVHMMINYSTQQSKVAIDVPVAEIEAALEKEKEEGKSSWKQGFFTAFKEARKKTTKILEAARENSDAEPAKFLESLSFFGASLGSETEGIFENKDTARVVVSTRRGWSVLMNSRREFKLLNMADQAVALARFARAPQMRVFYVDTTGATVVERDELIKDLETRVSRSMSFDANKSLYEDAYSPAGWTDDMFIPVTGQRGDMRVETVGGDTDVRAMVDVDYFLKRWFSAVHMPQAFMGFEEMLPGFNADKSLESLDIRFASVIHKIQDSDVMAMKRLAQIHIKYKHGVEVPLDNINLGMQYSSSAEESELLENLTKKMDLIDSMLNLAAKAGINEEQAARDLIEENGIFDNDKFKKWLKMGDGDKPNE